MENSITPKSFWKKPEGKTGGIFGIGILAGLGWLAYKLLPYLVEIAENTLYLCFLVAGIGAVLYVAFDPKFRNMIWYLYQIIMRKLTGFIIEIDPINIIKAYIQSLRDRREEMSDQITKLAGQQGKLESQMAENEEKRKDSLRLAQEAQKLVDKGRPEMRGEITINTREAGRLQESNAKLAPLAQRMKLLRQFLDKMYANTGYLIRDMESEIRVKETEYSAVKASHSAMRSAISIINGDPDKKIIFDQAMEYLKDDMGRKVGEVDRFMELSSEFINGMDLQSANFETKGLEMLERLNSEDFSSLLNEVPTQKQPITVGRVTNTNSPVKQGGTTNYFD